MTERLTTLLREEAADLLPPPPPIEDILGTGHRLHRRRRITQAAGGAALAAVVATGVVLGAGSLTGDPRTEGQRGIDPATAAYLDHGAFATGTTVHLGDGSTVDVGENVKVVYYTSAGLLVRSGDSAATDDAGPSHYTLVRPDGSLTRLDLDLGDRVPAADPEQPLMAYTVAAQGGGPQDWEVVVRDVTTDTEVARVPVSGPMSGGWEAPPVSLDGDTVYVAFDDEHAAVDWRTSQVSVFEGGSVAGGRTVQSGAGTVDVVDVATGEVLYSTPDDAYPYLDLSPDGSFVKVVQQDETEGDGFDVVDLDTGEVTTIAKAPWDFGWTPAGNLVSVDLDAREVTTCSATGECDTTPVRGTVSGQLKLAGISYES